MSIAACGTPASPGGIIEPNEIDGLSSLGALWVLADGRLIWQKYEDLPEGANSLSTGLLEQRLTPEGVELMRSEATAAFSSGEVSRCNPNHRAYSIFYVPAGGGFAGNSISADNEHLARVVDPWSWLPATAWEDREIRAYVPSTYLVMFSGEACEVECNPPDPYTAQLPAAVVNLIDSKFWERKGGFLYARFTTDEARAFAAALDDAGLEQDGLLNAYQLDYQYEYNDESGDTVMHIVFSPFTAAGARCGGAGELCRPGP